MTFLSHWSFWRIKTGLPVAEIVQPKLPNGMLRVDCETTPLGKDTRRQAPRTFQFEETCEMTATFRVLILGDIHFGESYASGGARILAEHGYSYSTKHLNRFVENADAVVVNLETPLVRPDQMQSPLKGQKPYVHWGDPDGTISELKRLGVTAVSLANNHAVDYGMHGLETTLDVLADAGIHAFGAGADARQAGLPLSIGLPDYAGGGRIDMYAAFRWRPHYDRDFNFYARSGKPGVRSLSVRSASRIKQVDASALNVFYPHWGADYRWVLAEQRKVAEVIAARGFDWTIGHGAHTLQEFEMVGGMPTIYGIGNGVFQSKGRFGTAAAAYKTLPYGAWAMLEVSHKGDGRYASSLRLYPVYADNRVIDFQPHPVDSRDFIQIAERFAGLAEAYNEADGAVEVGQDDLGYYFRFEAPRDSDASAGTEAAIAHWKPGEPLLDTIRDLRLRANKNGAVASITGAEYRVQHLKSGTVYFPDTRRWSLKYSKYAKAQRLSPSAVALASDEALVPVVVSESALPLCGRPLLRVKNSRDALYALSREARTKFEGTVVGITGTVGKTTTKDLVTTVLGGSGVVVATDQSSNTIDGVALTASRLLTQPDFAVFEAAISSFARRFPSQSAADIIKANIAIVTALGAAHMDVAPTLHDAAKIKSRLVEGMQPGGVVVLSDSLPHEEVFLRAARNASASAVLKVGEASTSDGRLISWEPDERGAAITVDILGHRRSMTISSPGLGSALNCVTALVVAHLVGIDIDVAIGRLLEHEFPSTGVTSFATVRVSGGDILLIDDTRNAADLSIAAALVLAGKLREQRGGGLLVGLGHVVNLGDNADEVHATLAPSVRNAKARELLTTGDGMSMLRAALDEDMPTSHYGSPEELALALYNRAKPGDVILVKGSHRGTGFRKVPRVIKRAGMREEERRSRVLQALDTSSTQLRHDG